MEMVKNGNGMEKQNGITTATNTDKGKKKFDRVWNEKERGKIE
jgi:hypothetical protein